ncbi:High-affinity glucose transporter [Colletotrichum trifolii]|uniref:High-affinity glucose transporter n=1 Tax=Colletotrichum trifolii TaxID=5466 RepID=A0A4R8RHY8_COLTR|nr:High-affinity glucose transporter [Colletotrichum trifolii]
MMIIGRALSGFSTGCVYPTAPVYLAELSLPENRGFLVGLKGLMNTLGFFAAGWVGYAGSFAHRDLQWRVPLATQIPPALLLAIMTIFLPYSPRWLAMRERYDEPKMVMYLLHHHRGAEVVKKEFAEMCSQIQLEADRKKPSKLMTLFTRRYIRRTLLVCMTVNCMKLSGSNVIQNYQSIMYNSLGYKGRTVLFIGALYGFMAVIGQVINVFFIGDHWTRRTTVISDSFCLPVLLAVLTALSEPFPGDSNPHGSRAGVAISGGSTLYLSGGTCLLEVAAKFGDEIIASPKEVEIDAAEKKGTNIEKTEAFSDHVEQSKDRDWQSSCNNSIYGVKQLEL